MADSSSSSSAGPDDGRVLDVDVEQDVVIITPRGDLGEFVVSLMSDEAEEALEHCRGSGQPMNLILDLRRTDYFGSSALGFFVRLWKRVRESGGKMLLCNVSEHENELLRITRLSEFWTMCDSLESARSEIAPKP